ncbi:uncharacterized protein LOC126326051 [Schistocerca gregaria]|uniref:uncharacterized protein LOC126326051 n=1 Tax=Schistocerca gregaria TaxID=7010 RepID=UPI00211DCF0E|nr:uncharacterized protein LOC126326051 [Schistocerca gregaria]
MRSAFSFSVLTNKKRHLFFRRHSSSNDLERPAMLDDGTRTTRVLEKEGEFPDPKFVDFRSYHVIPKWLSRQLSSVSIDKPTPVQRATIPAVFQGKNVVGIARTGQGKTLCFAVPIFSDVAMDPGAFRALILAPTRELVLQIAEEFYLLGDRMKIRTQAIIGGLEQNEQTKILETKPHILIATPGRLAQIISNGATAVHLVSFRRIKYLVLDEADRLLEPDFSEDLKTILAHVPPERQTLLFSATMTLNIEKLVSVGQDAKELYVYQETGYVEKKQCDSEFSKVSVDGKPMWSVPSTLTMEYIFIPQVTKECYLVYLLHKYSHLTGIIIFVPSCEACEVLAGLIEHSKVPLTVSRLNRFMKQKERISALTGFKSGTNKILIATDLASRGLDIPLAQLVIHMNVPNSAEDYVHRVGRTARKGRHGNSILLIDQYQVESFLRIEKQIAQPVTELKLEEQEVLRYMNEAVTARELGRSKLEDEGFFEKIRHWASIRRANKRRKRASESVQSDFKRNKQ